MTKMIKEMTLDQLVIEYDRVLGIIDMFCNTDRGPLDSTYQWRDMLHDEIEKRSPGLTEWRAQESCKVQWQAREAYELSKASCWLTRLMHWLGIK